MNDSRHNRTVMSWNHFQTAFNMSTKSDSQVLTNDVNIEPMVCLNVFASQMSLWSGPQTSWALASQSEAKCLRAQTNRNRQCHISDTKNSSGTLHLFCCTAWKWTACNSMCSCDEHDDDLTSYDGQLGGDSDFTLSVFGNTLVNVFVPRRSEWLNAQHRPRAFIKLYSLDQWGQRMSRDVYQLSTQRHKWSALSYTWHDIINT